MTEPSVVHRDLKIQGGVPVFRGTRVPVRSLLDYLEAGDEMAELAEMLASTPPKPRSGDS